MLLIFLISVLGLSSAIYTLPKESTPKIEFGIISINTIYPWVNPVDMDTLITEEIEDALEDVKWIDSIQSTSRVWVANTTITLQNWIDVKEALVEVKDEVDKLRLPEDAEDPLVIEVSSDTEQIFELIIYGDETLFPRESLIQAAHKIKQELEGKDNVTSIDINWTADYDIEVQIDRAKAQELGISLNQISSAIRAFNRNTPLGQYEVDELEYDFRIQWELSSEFELLDIPVNTDGFSIVTIGDLATLIRKYDNESIQKIGLYQSGWNNAISLTFNKKEWSNVFKTSKSAKDSLEQMFNGQAFAGIQYVFAQDISETIKEDYANLFNSFWITIICVFLCLLLFVWWKESLIATIGIFLAYCITFIVLDLIWFSLNFLTNFSLVLTLWIAIDTAIVVIEWAYEKLKLWFTPQTAILSSVHDFKAPLIAWTSTTIVVFIPMMVLPDVLGKFLAYIPITVFITLIAALFIALTLNAALFFKLSKDKKKYEKLDWVERFMSEEERVILAHERVWKEAKTNHTLSFKEKTLEKLNSKYEEFLRWYLSKRALRMWSIALPFILMILSIALLWKQIGFTLFPSGDEGRFDIAVTGQVWSTEESMEQWLPYIDSVLTDIEELDHYKSRIDGNKISLGIELIQSKKRKKLGQRNVFDVEKAVNKELVFLQQEGLQVESQALSGGPPSGKPVAIKLIADSNDKFTQLLETARDIQTIMRATEGTKNVTVSSQETPGQFIYTFDQAALSTLWLTPDDITWQVAFALNGLRAGSIKVGDQDPEIKVLFEEFSEIVSPTDVLGIIVPTKIGPIKIGEVMNYSIENAVAEISREDAKIQVRIWSDLAEWFERQAWVVQADVLKQLGEYPFPTGISFENGWESQENAELILATANGILVAFFLIFVILVLQFNSYRKPVIIMYSVICALLWVNIGLYIMGQPYSMPFAIWFIALTGIVVNDAIVMIDRANINISRKVKEDEAIIEAWRSRLQPIILTTLTTVLWILPIALQDEFWAGLWYTIVFWLVAWSTMTLFVIPSLFYELIVERKLTIFKVLFWSAISILVILLLGWAVYLNITARA